MKKEYNFSKMQRVKNLFKEEKGREINLSHKAIVCKYCKFLMWWKEKENHYECEMCDNIKKA